MSLASKGQGGLNKKELRPDNNSGTSSLEEDSGTTHLEEDSGTGSNEQTEDGERRRSAPRVQDRLFLPYPQPES